MRAGNAWIMLRRSRDGEATPRELGFGTQSLTIFIEDIQAHFERAKSGGVALLEDLHETEYGELQYAAEDLEGHHWLFSRHARDLSPDRWGARVSEVVVPTPQICPMLAVSDGAAAIEFYKAAFRATVLWHLEGGGHVVCGLAVGGARFFLATEDPAYGTRSPAAAQFTTVRIELFVDDPEAVQGEALAAGAVLAGPVEEHTYAMAGPCPIRRMWQGAVVDPFGHMWLIGRVAE